MSVQAWRVPRAHILDPAARAVGRDRTVVRWIAHLGLVAAIALLLFAAQSASAQYFFDDFSTDQGWSVVDDQLGGNPCYAASGGSIVRSADAGQWSMDRGLAVLANPGGTELSNHVVAQKRLDPAGLPSDLEYSVMVRIPEEYSATTEAGPELSMEWTRNMRGLGWRTYTAAFQYEAAPGGYNWNIWAEVAPGVADWVAFKQQPIPSGEWFEVTLQIDFEHNMYRRIEVAGPSIHERMDLWGHAMAAEAKSTENAFWITLEAENRWNDCGGTGPTMAVLHYDDVVVRDASSDWLWPAIVSTTTRDHDSDGYVDHVEVKFTDPVDPSGIDLDGFDKNVRIDLFNGSTTLWRTVTGYDVVAPDVLAFAILEEATWPTTGMKAQFSFEGEAVGWTGGWRGWPHHHANDGAPPVLVWARIAVRGEEVCNACSGQQVFQALVSEPVSGGTLLSHLYLEDMAGTLMPIESSQHGQVVDLRFSPGTVAGTRDGPFSADARILPGLHDASGHPLEAREPDFDTPFLAPMPVPMLAYDGGECPLLTCRIMLGEEPHPVHVTVYWKHFPPKLEYHGSGVEWTTADPAFEFHVESDFDAVLACHHDETTGLHCPHWWAPGRRFHVDHSGWQGPQAILLHFGGDVPPDFHLGREDLALRFDRGVPPWAPELPESVAVLEGDAGLIEVWSSTPVPAQPQTVAFWDSHALEEFAPHRWRYVQQFVQIDHVGRPAESFDVPEPAPGFHGETRTLLASWQLEREEGVDVWFDPIGYTSYPRTAACEQAIVAGGPDLDQDGVPDPCTGDSDLDGLFDPHDNCPVDANPAQEDADLDGIGDPCDATPRPVCPTFAEMDGEYTLYPGDMVSHRVKLQDSGTVPFHLVAPTLASIPGLSFDAGNWTLTWTAPGPGSYRGAVAFETPGSPCRDEFRLSFEVVAEDGCDEPTPCAAGGVPDGTGGEMEGAGEGAAAAPGSAGLAAAEPKAVPGQSARTEGADGSGAAGRAWLKAALASAMGGAALVSLSIMSRKRRR